MLLLLLTLIVSGSIALDITRVPGGIVQVDKQPVYEVEGYATVYVTLNQEADATIRWCSRLRFHKAALTSETAKEYGQLHVFNKCYSHPGKNQYLMRTQFLLDLICPSTARSKRGLFNFIGNAFSSLFGIPSADDIQNLAKGQRMLNDKMVSLQKVQNQVVGRVNQLSKVQVRLVRQTNILTQGLRSLTATVNYMYRTSRAAIAMNRVCSYIMIEQDVIVEMY